MSRRISPSIPGDLAILGAYALATALAIGGFREGDSLRAAVGSAAVVGLFAARITWIVARRGAIMSRRDESPVVLSYGGGRQTVALCVLIRRGILPRPDRAVAADTGRENPMTWEYLDHYVRPMLAEVGLAVEVAPHSLATVDLYAHNGDLLIPAFTEAGKLPTFCSDEWKARVIHRHLRVGGAKSASLWIGYAFDERRRWEKRSKAEAANPGPWRSEFPLVDLMLTSADCERIVRDAGLPVPHRSSCYMCPHKSNAEWRVIRDEHPAEWEAACRLDEEIREQDNFSGGSGVYLHHSRVPLRDADLDTPESPGAARQCGLGLCFV